MALVFINPPLALYVGYSNGFFDHWSELWGFLILIGSMFIGAMFFILMGERYKAPNTLGPVVMVHWNGALVALVLNLMVDTQTLAGWESWG